jgi:hypothetical protein
MEAVIPGDALRPGLVLGGGVFILVIAILIIGITLDANALAVAIIIGVVSGTVMLVGSFKLRAKLRRRIEGERADRRQGL